MNIKRLSIAITVCSFIFLAGCGKKTLMSEKEQAICGDWAYIHDKETTVVSFNNDGTAKYEGKKYNFTCDETFVELTDSKGTDIKLRYVFDDEGLLLYKNTKYKYNGEGTPEGLYGVWKSPENWSFEFTKDGTFMEDGYFPGIFYLDEKNTCFKLIYNDHFEDTVCYYQAKGEDLLIEYPWQMVKAE